MLYRLDIGAGKQINVNQQGVKVTDIEPLFVSGHQWKFSMVGIVKFRIKTAEEASHGNIHFPVSVIDGRVENHGFAMK